MRAELVIRARRRRRWRPCRRRRRARSPRRARPNSRWRARDRPARGTTHCPERLRRPAQRLRLGDGALPRAGLRGHRAAGPCVENQTIDFFLVLSNRYVTNPLPEPPARPTRTTWTCGRDLGVHAADRQVAARLQVARGRAQPTRSGKFVARDIAFRGMTVFRDARGRKRLYVAGVTADEYLRRLKRKYPPRILSSDDGRHWRATPARDVVVRVPYGVFRPMSFLRWRSGTTACTSPPRRA